MGATFVREDFTVCSYLVVARYNNPELINVRSLLYCLISGAFSLSAHVRTLRVPTAIRLLRVLSLFVVHYTNSKRAGCKIMNFLRAQMPSA